MRSMPHYEQILSYILHFSPADSESNTALTGRKNKNILTSVLLLKAKGLEVYRWYEEWIVYVHGKHILS